MPTAPKSTQPGQGGDSKQRSISLRWIRESGVMTFLVACGLFTLLTTVLIIVVLSGEAYRFFTFNEVVVDRLGDDRLAGTFEQADDGWVFQIADEQRGRIAFVDAERARELRLSEEADMGEDAARAAQAQLLNLDYSIGENWEYRVAKVGDLVRLYAPDQGGISPTSEQVQLLDQVEAQREQEQAQREQAVSVDDADQAESAEPVAEAPPAADADAEADPAEAGPDAASPTGEPVGDEADAGFGTDEPAADPEPAPAPQVAADQQQTEQLRENAAQLEERAEALDFDPDNYAEFEITRIQPDRLFLSGGPDAPITAPVVASVHHPVVSLREFLFSIKWNPLLGAEQNYGIWALISGTVMVTVIAMSIAIPLGLITAIWLSEYAPAKVRGVLKPVLEVLAGVPTVVYGFFALTVLTPALRGSSGFIGSITGLWDGQVFAVFNVTSAGIAVGILTLPIVTSLSEDALRAVPRSLREASYGLGATRVETALRVVVPAGLSGIIAACLLAIARSVGETMIVALAAGSVAQFSADITGSIQPMTGYMVQIFKGDVSSFGPEYASAYAVGATLFVLTLLLTLVGHLVRIRYRQQYD